MSAAAGSIKVHGFHGGLHLNEHKNESTGRPIRPAALPSRIILPLQQHIGAPAKPLVEVGDYVYRGQMVAEPDGYVSTPIHASTSGTVVAIDHGRRIRLQVGQPK